MSITSPVEDLLQRAEQLTARDFEAFFSNILTLNARRKTQVLRSEETILLKKINREFSAKRLERFLELEQKRQNETLTEGDRTEAIRLSRDIDRYDAQHLELIVQLAALRNQPFDVVMKQLGLPNQKRHEQYFA